MLQFIEIQGVGIEYEYKRASTKTVACVEPYSFLATAFNVQSNQMEFTLNVYNVYIKEAQWPIELS